MTVEEIEIIVTAKVEEALKEFQKMLAIFKETMKQAQEAFSKVDTKAMTNKIRQAVNIMKKKMQDLKKSSENNEISIRVNNKEAQKQISKIQKQIDSLQEKINARKMKLNIINPQIDKIVSDTRKQVTPDGISPNDKSMDTVVNKSLSSNKEFTSLDSQAQKLYTEIEMYNKQLDEAKKKMTQLEQTTNKTATTQKRLGGFFNSFKQKVEQAKPSLSGVKNIFSQMPSIGQNLSKVTQNITNNIKGMGTGFKNGLGHVLKYAGALFSLESIYSTLSGCANTWLSSQNAGAKQLSANIDYMKYAMGSAFAPVIQYVTNLIYQLMKAIQSVVYALFRVNIFANASAKSYASMAGSAKKAKQETKQLAGVHDEINNIQSNNNSNSGSSNGSATPSFDLSGIDNQMSPLAQKLYDFFKPLVDSWNKYGEQVILAFKNAISGIGQAIGAMWKSVETLFTNGTIYSIIANILNSIGKIGTAWANAWNKDNNGTEIIQGIANMINDITVAILNLVSSTEFQSFLDGVISAFSGIVQFIEPIVSGFSEMAEKMLEIVASTIGDILKTVGDTLQAIAQNEVAVEVLKALGEAIAIVVGAIILWNAAQLILNGLMGLFAIITSPLTLIILGIVAVITAAILIFQNWGTISEWLGQKFTEAKEAITNAFQNIGQWFSDRWNDICNVFSNVGQWFSDKFNEAKDGVQNAWQNIGNWFGDRKNDITNAFSSVGQWFSDKFQDAYNGITSVFGRVGNFFSGIWNGIKSTFSNLGTNIGDAISGAVKSGINGVISMIERTINKAIGLINGGINLINKIPGVYVGSVPTLSLPRLAKGNVAYDETLAVFGEYSGASNNPEITAPQNILRETFEDVLSNYSGNNNDSPIYLTVNVGNSKLGQILLDDLRNMKRQSGKDIEALVGG